MYLLTLGFLFKAIHKLCNESPFFKHQLFYNQDHKMPSTPCRAKGCAGLVNSRLKKGYCDQHAHLRTQSNWTKHQQRHGTTTERGYGYAWQKRRAEVLQRDNHLCQVCLAKGYFTPATEVDHVINKASGGTDDIENLQAICHVCHKSKTQTESHGGRGGKKVQNSPK